MLRHACACLGTIGLVTLAATAAGCQPPSETTREKGVTDASGYALVHAVAPGDNHHWSVDVSMRSAPEGTYALVFSTNEPPHHGWFAIAPNDPALRCATAQGKACTLPDHGDVTAVTRIGPGGAGVLRAMFDVGVGGWFTVVRVEGGSAPSSATFDIQIVSEALTKEEEPHRFAIEQVR